jgi:hypothetical protein
VYCCEFSNIKWAILSITLNWARQKKLRLNFLDFLEFKGSSLQFSTQSEPRRSDLTGNLQQRQLPENLANEPKHKCHPQMWRTEDTKGTVKEVAEWHRLRCFLDNCSRATIRVLLSVVLLISGATNIINAAHCCHCWEPGSVSSEILRNFYFVFRETKYIEISRKWSYKTVQKLILSTF